MLRCAPHAVDCRHALGKVRPAHRGKSPDVVCTGDLAAGQSLGNLLKTVFAADSGMVRRWTATVSLNDHAYHALASGSLLLGFSKCLPQLPLRLPSEATHHSVRCDGVHLE